MPELKRLLALQALMATRSVTAAARELGQTPSAVSQSIAALTRDVGTPLFIRVGRRMVPTRAAVVVHHQAAGFLSEALQFDAVIRGLRASASGVARIGVTSDAAAGLVAIIAPGVAARGDIRVDLHEASADDLRGMLNAGLVDVAVIDEVVSAQLTASTLVAADLPIGVAEPSLAVESGEGPRWVVADGAGADLIFHRLTRAQLSTPVLPGPSHRTTLLLVQQGQARTACSALHVAAAGVEVRWAEDGDLSPLRHRVVVHTGSAQPRTPAADLIIELLHRTALDVRRRASAATRLA